MTRQPKVILYNAISVDGKIAKINDSTPWSKTEWQEFHRVVKQFGNIVVGRRTFDMIKGKQVFRRCGNPKVVVLSRYKRGPVGDTVFVRYPKEAVSVLYDKGFSRILLGGGSRLNSSFLNEDLVDEVWLDIEPMLFGSGIPLCRKLLSDKQLALISIRKLSRNLVQARYKVVK